jgi:hypothetical protein
MPAGEVDRKPNVILIEIGPKPQLETTKLSFTNFSEEVKYINQKGRHSNRGNSGIIVALRQAETARNGGLAEEASSTFCDVT